MNIRKSLSYTIIVFSIFFLSCGMPDIKKIEISGSVDLSEADLVSGPSFIIISNTDDFKKIENDPLNSVILIARIGDDNRFSIDLSETGVREGDNIYLVGFVDNDYTEGIPFPTEGDYLGFYFDDKNWQMAYILSENNMDLNIKSNRKVYDFNAEVSGTIKYIEVGEITLIAYAGDIESMDYSSLNFENIIGYSRVSKPEGSAGYSLNIMPFGNNIPIENVFIIAFLDKNNNGIPDGGDRMGFYTNNDNNTPSTVTINEGNLTGIDLDLQMEIQEPSGYEMSIQGSFTVSDYDGLSPIFILIAESDDPALLFNNPINAIKAFQRVKTNDNGTIITDENGSMFNIDLSETDLEPYDSEETENNGRAMVIALWDKDFNGGFPNPTGGDRVGYYQNTNPDNFEITIPLSEGINSVSPQGDWDFTINKIIYDYETTIEFKLDPSNRPEGLNEDHSLIAIAVYYEGVNDEWLEGGLIPDYGISDVNYVLGMAAIPYRQNPEYIYSFDIFNIIDDRITNSETMDIYVYVIYDRDGDGAPSSGDDIAAYWENKFFGIEIFGMPIGIYKDVPDKWSLTSDEINILSEPDGDPENPYAVKFLGETY